MKPNLASILVQDEKTAKSSEFVSKVCPAGVHDAKFITFVEEDTYQYFTFEIDGDQYNFFYNYYLKDSTDLNLDLIEWIKNLATIQYTDTTPLIDIVNSAIGSTFKITTYNYTSKTGKNAGKQQHAISFRDVPVIQAVNVISGGTTTNTSSDDDEEIDLPI